MLVTDKNQRLTDINLVAKQLDTLNAQLKHRTNWWQRRHPLAKAALMTSFSIMLNLAWTSNSLVTPNTTPLIQQLKQANSIAILPITTDSKDPQLENW